MPLKLYSKGLGPYETNCYCLVNVETKKALVIDAPEGAWDFVSNLAGKESFNVEALWLTHGHWDHILDNAAFQKATIPIYAHKADQVWIENVEIMNMRLPKEFQLRPSTVDHFFEIGPMNSVLGEVVEIRHVPGHCPGNVLFYFPDQKMAFPGDAIFAGSVGRTDLPGGDFQVLERSIQNQIYTLPESTTLYCGHGPATTVAEEKAHNLYVRSKGM